MIKAELKDLEKILDFYKKVCEKTKDVEKYSKWSFELHPTTTMIEGFVASGKMYYLGYSGEIKAAVAITYGQESDYTDIEWTKDISNDEIATIHIFAVNPDFQRKGIGKELMSEVIDLLKTRGIKSIRFDALCCNEPAIKFYESIGFKKVGEKTFYTTNAGNIDFYLYELNLK